MATSVQRDRGVQEKDGGKKREKVQTGRRSAVVVPASLQDVLHALYALRITEK